MVRAALYARVSTDDQAKEGYSLDAQLERLRLYAAAQGWTVAAEYVDDGHSGRTTNRPAYRKLIAEADTWDSVLVLKMDRIHRNSRNFMAMMDDFRKHKKEFVSATESLDTSNAVGRAIMDILQRLAQMESEQTGERTFIGMDQKAKQGGGTLGKMAPFGYTWAEGKLTVVPDERPTVLGLFEAYARGARKQQLADKLNDAGIRGRRGSPWNVRTITNLLTNPTYCGAEWWDSRHLQLGTHEAIVPEPLFNDVQAKIREAAPRRQVLTLGVVEHAGATAQAA